MSLSCQHVVVIDDDPDYRELVRIALTDHLSVGHVQEFDSGASAFEALAAPARRQRDAPVIVDLHMPMVSGIEVVTTLRQRSYPGRIVVLSAQLTPHAKDCCVIAGADKVYEKPVSLAELTELLRAALA